MTRYHCTHCDHYFEYGAAKAPRCPRCLRHHGLEQAAADGRQAGRTRRRSPRRIVLLCAGLLGLAAFVVVLGQLVSQRRAVPRPGELGPLDSETLARTLGQRGIPATERVNPLDGATAVESLIVGLKATTPRDRAFELAKRLGQKLAAVDVDLGGAQRQGPRRASELARALQTGRVAHALSYELAITLVATLRAAGLCALLCEGFEQTAPVHAADPSGAVGRYVVALYPSTEALDKPPLLVLDPARAARLPDWAGGGGDMTMASKIREPRPLDDASAAARWYMLRALHQIDVDASLPERAYELAQWALDAAAPSASLRAAHAMVLAKAGGLDDGVAEARRALRLREDPPRRTLLAGLLLAQRKGSEAEVQFQKAIAEDPTFWPAQRGLAALRYMLGDRSGGDMHLAQAQKVAPEEPSVVALVANQKLATSEVEQGLALLRGLVKKDPSEQFLLMLYVALLQVGRQEEAQAVRDRLIEAASDKARTRELVQQLAQSAAAQGQQPAAESRPTAPERGNGNLAPRPKRFKLPDVSLTPEP